MVYRSQIKFKLKLLIQKVLNAWFSKESLKKINKVYHFRRNGSVAKIKNGENKFKVQRRSTFKGKWIYGGTRA